MPEGKPPHAGGDPVSQLSQLLPGAATIWLIRHRAT
jgi:hypothetical protein